MIRLEVDGTSRNGEEPKARMYKGIDGDGFLPAMDFGLMIPGCQWLYDVICV